MNNPNPRKDEKVESEPPPKAEIHWSDSEFLNAVDKFKRLGRNRYGLEDEAIISAPHILGLTSLRNALIGFYKSQRIKISSSNGRLKEQEIVFRHSSGKVERYEIKQLTKYFGLVKVPGEFLIKRKRNRVGYSNGEDKPNYVLEDLDAFFNS